MSELFIALIVLITLAAYATKRRECEHYTTEQHMSSRQDDVDDMRIEHELHMAEIEMNVSIDASHAEIDTARRSCDTELKNMDDSMKHMREMDEHVRSLR